MCIIAKMLNLTKEFVLVTSGEYLVSVVTPFHNARLNLFEKCVESLKKQTIGFENIEWIIALHPEIEETEDQLRARALPLRHNAIAHPCPNTLLLARHQQALCVDGGFQLYGLSRRELEALWAGK